MAKEVFLVTINEDLANVATEVYIYNSLAMANYKMGDVSWANLDEENVRMYHGVIIPATFLPNSFKGCTPRILIKNPEGYNDIGLENDYYFSKVPSDPAELAKTIEKLLDDDELFISASYHVRREHTMAEVELFLGTSIMPVFQVMDESVDEEIIERLSSLVDEIKATNTEIKDVANEA